MSKNLTTVTDNTFTIRQNNNSVSVLLVEDDPQLREAITDTLELAGFNVIAVESAEQALASLRLQQYEIIVSDINMPGMSGLELQHQISSQHLYIPLLLMTAYGSIEDAIRAMRSGAVDYLLKPFSPETLVSLVHKYSRGNDGKTPVAVADASKQLLQMARRIAKSNTTVLISGESGTGKEVIARYIHRHSSRNQQIFVALNCAAIPENMLEAILFGYEKGAFTGAYQSSAGKFEQANEGTLLLDEITEMPLLLQAKLLRVLQEREVERLGAKKVLSIDVRVIATSNRQLLEEVKAGRFREDLYYRLNVIPLRCLPLRERPEDILAIAQNLLKEHCQRQQRQGVYFSAEAEAILTQYHWPGNVRELDNVVQRALVMAPSCEIEKFHLMLDNLETVNVSKVLVKTSNDELNDQLIDKVGSDSSGLINKTVNLGSDLKQRELEVILSTLNDVNGSRKAAAEKLGISPRTLRYKLAKFREDGFLNNY